MLSHFHSTRSINALNTEFGTTVALLTSLSLDRDHLLSPNSASQDLTACERIRGKACSWTEWQNMSCFLRYDNSTQRLQATAPSFLRRAPVPWAHLGSNALYNYELMTYGREIIHFLSASDTQHEQDAASLFLSVQNLNSCSNHNANCECSWNFGRFLFVRVKLQGCESYIT